jgi:cobalt/nickel transport system permease protein
MCATPLLTLLLGLRLMIIPTALSLLMQALFFAHGGLTTLGANIISLAVVGPGVALVLARFFRGLRAPTWLAVGVACVCADLAVYAFDAVMLGLALQGERPFSYWFSIVLLGFAPVQGPLAVLEGLLSVTCVRALALRRLDLIPSWLRDVSAIGAHAPAVSIVVSLLFALSWCASLDAAERYRGLDETVIAATAAAAGQPASAPFLDLGQGELPLFLFSFASFVAGLVVGAGWVRLRALEAADHAYEP